MPITTHTRTYCSSISVTLYDSKKGNRSSGTSDYQSTRVVDIGLHPSAVIYDMSRVDTEAYTRLAGCVMRNDKSEMCVCVCLKSNPGRFDGNEAFYH